MAISRVESVDQVQREALAVAFWADDVPVHQAGYVRSRTYVSSVNRYLVEVDPAWLSGNNKGNLDSVALLSRAGYTNAEPVGQ